MFSRKLNFFIFGFACIWLEFNIYVKSQSEGFLNKLQFNLFFVITGIVGLTFTNRTTKSIFSFTILFYLSYLRFIFQFVFVNEFTLWYCLIDVFIIDKFRIYVYFYFSFKLFARNVCAAKCERWVFDIRWSILWAYNFTRCFIFYLS